MTADATWGTAPTWVRSAHCMCAPPVYQPVAAAHGCLCPRGDALRAVDRLVALERVAEAAREALLRDSTAAWATLGEAIAALDGYALEERER